MHFRSFRLRQFLYYLFPALIYPVFAWVSAEKKLKLLKFIDALTITGLVFLLIGVIYTFIRHGDFDISEYVTRRSIRKGNFKPFSAFKEDKKESRKDTINYPFCIAALLLLAAGILTACFY